MGDYLAPAGEDCNPNNVAGLNGRKFRFAAGFTDVAAAGTSSPASLVIARDAFDCGNSRTAGLPMLSETTSAAGSSGIW